MRERDLFYIRRKSDGSGGGSAVVETCKIIMTSTEIINFWATCYSDGQFYVVDASMTPVPMLDAPGESNPVTYVIENVVRYTALSIERMGVNAKAATGSGFQGVGSDSTTQLSLIITEGAGKTAYITVP